MDVKDWFTPEQPASQRRWRALSMSIASRARGAIAAVDPEYVIDSSGRYIAVVRLLGSDVGIVDDSMLTSRLNVLQDYIERNPDPIQRFSSSYLQPLDPYLSYLYRCFQGAEQHAPHLAPFVKEMAMYLETARESFQARLSAEYWVVTYGQGPGFSGGWNTRSLAQQKQESMTASHPERGGLWSSLRRSRDAARARAEQELDERCTLLVSTLKRAGVIATRIKGEELITFFNSAWNGNFTPPAFSPEKTYDPDELDDRVRLPDGALDVTANWVRTPGGFVRSFYLRDFTGIISADLIYRLAQEPGTRIIQFWEQVPMAEARRVLRMNRTIASSERYLRPQGDIPDFDWQARAQENDEIRAALSFRGEPIYRYRALIQQWAETEEQLEERSHDLLLKLEDHAQLTVHPARFRQEEALVSGLPVARCRIEKPERNLDAKSLARLAYPGPQNPLRSKGVWLGMALPSKLMVTMDLFGLQNPVIELVGIMGSGKSVTQKFLLTQLTMQGYPGFVLDGAREYIPTVEALGGLILKLGRADGPGFNPVHFDPLDEEEEGDPFITGLAFFLDWLEAALHPLSDIEKTVAGEAYLRALEGVGILRDDRETWERPKPILSDIHAALLAEPGDPDLGYDNPQIVARKLALALKPFSHGVYASLFNRQEQVSLGDAQLVCFDIYDVPDRLRLAYVHQLLAFVQRQTLRRYRYQGSVVVLDEGHLLLHDERSARILEHLVRNGRKAGQLMLFTQHTYADSQRNRSAQLAHRTAGATLVFRINRQDVATLDDLHLTEMEKELVVEQREGECLWVAPEGHLRLKILIPPTWYPRFTTKPQEVLEQQRAKAQQVSQVDPPTIEQTTLLPAATMTKTTIHDGNIDPLAVSYPQAAPLPAQTGELTAALVPVAYPANQAPAPDIELFPGDMSTWCDPVTSSWENALVGSNQIATDWLRFTQLDHEPAQESASSAEQSIQEQDSYLWLIWSRPPETPEIAEEGGDTYPDRKIGG